MKKYIIIGAISIVILCSIFAISYIRRVGNYKDKIKNIQINEVYLNDKKDGKYIGEFDADFIYAKVEVEIKNEKIVSINLLEHKNERGGPAEVIPKKVVESQSLKVDAVSGATNSSKVILKAIENALKN